MKKIINTNSEWLDKNFLAALLILVIMFVPLIILKVKADAKDKIDSKIETHQKEQTDWIIFSRFLTNIFFASLDTNIFLCIIQYIFIQKISTCQKIKP